MGLQRPPAGQGVLSSQQELLGTLGAVPEPHVPSEHVPVIDLCHHNCSGTLQCTDPGHHLGTANRASWRLLGAAAHRDCSESDTPGQSLAIDTYCSR